MHFRLQIGQLSINWGRLKPPNFYIVRHGRSRSNEDPRYSLERATPAIELSDLGHQQAKEAGAFLAQHFAKMGWWRRPTHVRIYHSHYTRSHQTAEHIYNAMSRSGLIRRLDFKEDLRIHELETGIFGGMRMSEIADLEPHFAKVVQRYESQGQRYFSPRLGGENASMVSHRLLSFIGACYRDTEKYGVRNFVVVSHGYTNRVFDKVWMQRSIADFQEMKDSVNCGIRLYTANKRGRRVDNGYIFKPSIVTTAPGPTAIAA